MTQNNKMLLSKEQKNENIPSQDVVKLLKQYNNSLSNYHEIQLLDSIEQIRNHWPLLDEIYKGKNT